MGGKLKIIFGDLLRTLRQLWLQFIGGMFLVIGIVFVSAAIQEYWKYVHNPQNGSRKFIMVLISSGVMIFFALESFWKSRKPR
jgi:hypothetical protein